MNRLKVASFTVHATAVQSARWKQAAEAEGFTSAGAWLAAAADAYLRARVKAGAPIPLAWRRGVFRVVLDGEELTVRGHVSTPFATLHGDGHGRMLHLHRLVYMPTARVLATVRTRQEARALAAELARLWVRGDGEEPAADVRGVAESLARGGVLP